jgi:hypothetical protein
MPNQKPCVAPLEYSTNTKDPRRKGETAYCFLVSFVAFFEEGFLAAGFVTLFFALAVALGAFGFFSVEVAAFFGVALALTVVDFCKRIEGES